MIEKGRQVFHEKNSGVTPSVAAQDVTHPSDATASGSDRSLPCCHSEDFEVTPTASHHPFYPGSQQLSPGGVRFQSSIGFH